MLNFTEPQNTRIAPSPTGNAHIGFARTAYLNYLAARSTGGKFILRIDDTDKERSKQEYTDDLMRTLEWLGLEWDEVYYQSKRYHRYKQLADEVVGGDWAVKHDATYLSPQEFRNEWTDLVSGKIAISQKDHEAIENLVILRADESPTYHWASCIDDMDMGVNLVIRGTDHISNTAKHLHIYDALGVCRPPQFAHVGLIHFNGKKISKRDKESNMEHYKANYSPEAVLNMCLRMGWGHPDPNIDKRMPLIDKQAAIDVFKEGHLKSVKSTLDINKLDWLNKKFANRSKAQTV